jgi:hypothetical protein
MVLLVNRLELSRQQMETLLSTINGLLDQTAVLDQKRGAFEQEMIAFSGTAEELDVRLASFQTEMKTAKMVLGEGMAAAVATVKDTLTMKQGEILTAAFPRIVGRLDVVSTDSMSASPQARAGSLRATAAGTKGRMMIAGGQAPMTPPSSQPAPEATQGSASIVGQVQTMVERIRERVAGRLTVATPSAGTACPMAEVMMMSPQGPSSVSGQVDGVEASAGDFGAVTISLPGGDALTSVDVVPGNRSLVSWLGQFAQVLELKLPAMK